MKKRISLLLSCALLFALCCSCGTQTATPSNTNLDTSQTITLTVCGPWSSCKAIENAAQAFSKKYPNCEIQYEYVENYTNSLLTRMESVPESIDLFLTDNIHDDSPIFPYSEDLAAHSELDLSSTNPALIRNAAVELNSDGTPKRLHTIPLGGELRGLYVNKTLLSSVGLDVPTNADELLNACQVLKDAGYIPMNGNPGFFGQRLMYPYICNLISNSADYQATYDQVNQCEAGVSELFRQPMEFLYTLSENGYYNYKYVETELNMFTDNSDEGCARYFFNALADGDSFKKVDDLGSVAFMVGTLSQKQTMEQIKEDYHSNIDYEFILAPVSDEGGFAYISPAKGIAVSSGSSHVDWSVEFLNFLFTNEVNTQFASDINYIPNTTDSFDVIRDLFDIPDSHISDVGQATFDYDFFNTVNTAMIDISKSNNPKYMDTDENGTPVMYSFDYYMESLEAAFAAQRESGGQ